MASHHHNQDSDPDRFWQLFAIVVVAVVLLAFGLL